MRAVSRKRATIFTILATLLISANVASAQIAPAGPRIFIKGVMLIDGTGAPMRGPMNIVIAGDTIKQIEPTTPTIAQSRPTSITLVPQPGDQIIDGTGKYVMPGIIEAHMHYHAPLPKAYVYKLFLAHGVTSLRNVDGRIRPDDDFPATMVAEAKRLRAGEELGPRLWVYAMWPEELTAPEEAAPLIDRWAKIGVDGVKIAFNGGLYPDTFAAIAAAAKRNNLGLAVHIAEARIPGVTALSVAQRATSIEHHYGYAETALKAGDSPDLPADYNYQDERQRFRTTLGIWLQADVHKLETQTVPALAALSRDGEFTMVPTMVVYEKQRDLTRAANAPWLERYTLPGLLKSWRTPKKTVHGAIFDRWTSLDEAQAAQAYVKWEDMIRLYREQGGHVAVGSDSGGPFQLFGFQTIREMELLEQAGLTPLEVIQSATMEGARAVRATNLGVLRPGYKADLLILDENPLADLKVLLGDRPPVDEDGAPQRRTLIRSVILGGKIIDPDQLLADVEAMTKARVQTGAP